MLSLPLEMSGTDSLPITAASGSGGDASSTLGPSPGRIDRSLQFLESQSQAVRMEIRTKEQANKATPGTYSRHVNSYQSWWDVAEALKVSQNRNLVALPAFPIISAKVSMFLQYETTREKVSSLIPLVIACPNGRLEKAWRRNYSWIVGWEVPNLAGHLGLGGVSPQHTAPIQGFP